ncbi:KAP family NTPase [Acinetobacter johnsonii]|uniref:KAP family NTPase n=1 Tax=Acinetobacter johnsonii TaxID=40214 RepID=A0AA42MRQ3_ACIJO|nr:P-loop NTPase fold protein [Acinetobacter johnsonii]MDH0968547.1 KAP family NTPase [Acinetobacter johnsonii]
MIDTNQLNWQRTNLENIETAWEGDLWDRKRLGIQLTKYVDRLQCGAVLALDARWGEGKTWFVRHWKKHLEDENHNVIYLDAFANDYLEDPFLVISSEITSCLAKDDNVSSHINTFKEKAAAAYQALLPSLPKVLLTLGLNLISGGVLGTLAQQAYETGEKVIESASDEIGEKIKESIEAKIESHEADKNTLLVFKQELAQLADKLEKPLVFVIDELDRCRPDFAIRLIERIKHFFDIPKIVFVLVMDKTQFSKVVCHNYGYDEKLGEEYLDKFVDFTVGLNTLTPKLQDNLKINIYDVFEKLGLDFSDAKFECCVDLIAFYVKDQSLSKRSIIKLASQFALLYSEKFDKYKNQILIILLVNKSFLLTSNDSLELYKVLLNQMDDYIAKNESDFSKFKALYAQSNYSTILIKAFFFYEENNISVFSELVDNFEQLNSSQKRLSIVSMRNLRPTENTDFLGSWKNYIFGGI